MGLIQRFIQKVTKKSQNNSSVPVASVRMVSKLDREDIIQAWDNGDKPSEIAFDMQIEPDIVARVIDAERKRREREKIKSAPADSIQEMNARIKQAELELKLLEKEWAIEDRRIQRQAELSEYTEDQEDEDNPDQMFQNLIMSILAAKMGAPTANTAPGQMIQNPANMAQYQQTTFEDTTHTAQGDTKQELTEDQIMQMISQVPKNFMRLIQKKPDHEILEIMQRYYPGRTPSEYQTGLAVIKKVNT